MGGLLAFTHGLFTLSIYIGCIVFALISAFWRPQYGVYYLALFMPLQTLRYRLIGYPAGEKFVDILVLGILIGILTHRGGAAWVRTRLGMLCVVWALFLYVSLWFGSAYLHSPWPITFANVRFSDWKNYIELPFFLFLASAAITNKKQIKILLAVMALSFLIVNRGFYDNMAGRDVGTFSYDVRDPGPLGYAGVNGLAAFEATSMLFLVAMLSFKIPRYVKFAIYGLLATGMYCLLFSFSRGGYVSLLGGLAFLGLVRSRKLLIVVAAVLIGWQTLLPVSVQERITMTVDDSGTLDPSVQRRIDLWTDAESLINENMVWGTGFDTYAFMDRFEGFHDTHNYFIKITLETGIIGLLFFLYILWRMFALGWRLYRTSTDPFMAALGLGFATLMVGTVFANFFGDRFSYLQVNGFMWILMGLVVRALAINEQEALKPAVSEGLVSKDSLQHGVPQFSNRPLVSV